MSTDAAENAAPLDLLLTEAGTGTWRRFRPDASTATALVSLARRPRATARLLAGLGSELAQVVAGVSALAPSTRDRRFSDPAWSSNPLLRRVVQGYLAAGRTVDQLVDAADLDWRDDHRVRFLVDNVREALAPSNVPLLNPASAKAVVDTAGLNFARGAGHLVRDLAAPPRVPQMVDPAPFEIGSTIAATPGSVVLRTEMLELIQYAPSTARVRETPVLIAPPTINKYYALDLAPGRSEIEYLVGRGQQVFVMSWRNPEARHSHWGLDAYVGAILDALGAVERITGSSRTVLAGVCSGGILAALTASTLAATGAQARLAGLVLEVTVLDNARAGTVGALTDPALAAAATALSRRQGYLDGRSLAEVFAWLRPGDLVWNYWVNNYLLGRTPPAFDILFWNADTVRMTAALHADFVDLAMRNALVTPGALTVCGEPVDLSAVTVDSYVVAGINDHITPWENCYRSTGLLGGETRFVLSTSGHIAALVNPPGNPKASYQVAKDTPPGAQTWLSDAETVRESWWPDLDDWLAAHGGAERPAPEQPGGGGLEVLAAAPGTYVLDS
ncbi:alpha/beta fold hydrolase [Actinomycetospora endophytica]|uniref:Alpha/beta fold hydrolase n=1 Tax=Actinomycetospora endophytica TaxID=2291215 RepID=A0ABS8PAJ7_9PSEU|nr:alpha/beta fold hydrolase [Actinomycetospora endophytica]MCD2195285.1 alpha/beta fold hydrolase [Actinomycetospora endophytica]